VKEKQAVRWRKVRERSTRKIVKTFSSLISARSKVNFFWFYEIWFVWLVVLFFNVEFTLNGSNDLKPLFLQVSYQDKGDWQQWQCNLGDVWQRGVCPFPENMRYYDSTMQWGIIYFPSNLIRTRKVPFHIPFQELHLLLLKNWIEKIIWIGTLLSNFGILVREFMIIWHPKLKVCVKFTFSFILQWLWLFN
jgi:hypothetical protein